ncbi:GerW family sporulation protein [Clostridium sp. DJ247]|uniref:GerW family sporulation protein n=1 Tax=Clostridium sp. DJ247 TaxID=2726188 RepID=UPI0016282688|nr:spore germination protein GerW family protein [Clostridium sp. DJ247]MBC2581080.1 sporulation protein [Clostridium sp. DJ247]
MDQNASFSQNINTLFSELQDFTKTESTMGKPVSFEDKTFIPIVSVTLGYGSGANPMKNKSGNGDTNSSGNIGLGARITTDAVVVINKDSVSMLPVNEKSNIDQVINKLPEVLTSFTQGNQQQNIGQTAGQNIGQTQQQNITKKQ